MKLQSKLFDNIRIRPRREEKPAPVEQICDWEGCDRPGTHKAPKGHRSEGQYHHFCLEHVRHYNTAFNFFAGMEKDELEEALHTPPKAETRKSFATGQAGARTAHGQHGRAAAGRQIWRSVRGVCALPPSAGADAGLRARQAAA
ncbi:hypothetical protein N8D56_06460 [Devosia sp. A8/3-2]|nr:hypothetical protein N8D56_06460 [Devosia sp. A8/3-2]